MVRRAALVVSLFVATMAWPAAAGREVAVTFDDLPVAGVLPRDLPASRALTTRLLAAITSHHVPTIGFVNEGKLGDPPDPGRIALLRLWLDAGADLGNHSYSHLDLNTTPLDRFEADVARGDAVTRALLAERGRTPRFFRHPFLHTGRELEVRDAFLRFLADRGCRVAPVTVDNDEYIFAAAYDRASARGDHALMRRVAGAYVPYMEAKFVFFERNSRDLVGYEMRQVLLLHANALNADRVGDLAAMLARRGYRFITLDRALEDPAYQLPDAYTGPGGITWIHRWALTRGVSKDFFRGEPEVPPFVADNARP
jgi:peptidoglycan/xylan/chitin deacetylase (PgdA/CDA1 family)